MSADEKKLVESIASAVSLLPVNDQKFIVGYAEGVRDMAKAVQNMMEAGQFAKFQMDELSSA